MTGAAMATDGEMPTPAESKIILREMMPGDIGWLTQQHGETYHREEGFDQNFEALVAEILVDFVRHHDPASERAFIAERQGCRLGSVFCTRQSEDIAKLRLFFLVPQARGLGLGRLLLEACLSFAQDCGYKRLELWTHKSHRSACALYLKYGFQMTGEEPVHEFGVDLVRQNWQIDLTTPLAFAKRQL